MTKIVCFSDTHCYHNQVILPEGDIAVFAGDCAGRGSAREVREFVEWYAKQPHKHKIMIAGNHDWGLANEGSKTELETTMQDLGITYLNDSGTEIDGIKFWGSPVQPRFCDWAFNRERNQRDYDMRKTHYAEAKLIKDHWDLIPEDTNVLVTHGPPEGKLDEIEAAWLPDNGRSVGCEELAKSIERLSELKLNIFGHIHSGYGQITENGVQYVNACVCDESYRAVNPIQVVEL